MVKHILKEVEYSKNVPVALHWVLKKHTRWLALATIHIIKKTMSALYVNEEKLLQIKDAMGKNPLLFLPTHRSYADFILIALIMFDYGIEIPCVAVGMDFQSTWLMGRLLRACSAFFVSRYFGDDNVYRTVFDEYVKKLIYLGEAPVEVFIEGKRSRSAKSLMPNFDLLKMIMETVYSGDVPDITIVPVNISYDRTLEEVLFAYEMLGIDNPKETFTGLIKGINMLNESYGNVFVDFCDPISTRRYIRVKSERTLDQEHNQILHLGHVIVYRQQNHTTLSTFNILALVLSNHMGFSDSPILLSEAAKDVRWLLFILWCLGASLEENVSSALGAIQKTLEKTLEIHKSLVKLNEDTIQLVSAHSPQDKIDASQIKGHKLDETTMNVAVPLLMLHQYINPCMHFFVNPAIITVIMDHLGYSGCISKSELFTKYQFLRALLTYEFVLYKEWEVKDFDDALQKLESIKLIDSRHEEQLSLGNDKKLRVMMCNTLYPFLSGYLSLGQFLMEIKPEPVSEKFLLQAGQSKLEADLRSGLIFNPYSLSLDMISCVISSLTDLQVLTRSKINEEVMFEVIHDKLMLIVSDLDGLVVKPQLQGNPISLISKHILQQDFIQ